MQFVVMMHDVDCAQFVVVCRRHCAPMLVSAARTSRLLASGPLTKASVMIVYRIGAQGDHIIFISSHAILDIPPPLLY